MLTLLSEIHFWSTQEDITIKPTDYGSFKYYSKKDSTHSLCLQSKKSYCEQRGLIWSPHNKRPIKLKDRLKELEEHLAQNKIVCFTWTEDNLQLLLSQGIVVKITTNPRSGDICNVVFDKQLVNRIQNEIICDGVISGQQVICICTDGHVFGYGGLWKDCWVIDAGSKRRLSLYGEWLSVWGKAGAEHPQPWSPLAKDHQRANLHLYWVGARGFELLAYKKTDGEPIEIVVSKICNKTIIVIEQKVSQRGAVSVEVNTLELIASTLKRVEITSVPLQTQVCCCTLSGCETWLLLGCIDGSLALLDRLRGSTRTIKASFIPTIAVWNDSNAVAAVANERGQLQYYDTALNCIKSQIMGEDCIPTGLLDLSCYFNAQITIASMKWGPKDLLVAVERGPLLVLTHITSSLGYSSLAHRYLTTGKIDKAIALLLSWQFNEQSFGVLQKIVAHLMRLPLTEENAQFLQNALGAFHCPPVPLSTEVRHRYGSQVSALTRRFFHQLVRASMFEMAFLLAVDLGHHDLFMDLHYVAVKIGETEMAAAARAQASALLSRCSSEASNCSRSSCSQCSDSNSCTSEESSLQENESVNDNYLTTNFNNITPKTYKSTPAPNPYVPPIPNVDLPKINYTAKPNFVKPPVVPPLSSNFTKTNVQSTNSLIVPPLPFTPPLPNTNCPSQLGIPCVPNFYSHPVRTYSMPSLVPQPNLNRNFNPFSISCPYSNNTISNSTSFSPLSASTLSVNNTKTTFMPIRPVVPPPLPVAPPLLPSNSSSFTTSTSTYTTGRKQQAKVKFSDTVTAFIVPEIKRPVRPAPPAHVMDPQKELADSLPLCHPNEDYLKDFTPVRRSEQNETPTQSKIKVVHFGVV